MDDERAALDFRAAMDALCEGVVACDARDHVLYLNPAAALLLGKPAHELVGVPWHTIARSDVELTTRTIASADGDVRISCLRSVGRFDGPPDGADGASGARVAHAHDELVSALLDGPAEGAVERALEAFTRAVMWDVAVLWCVCDDGALRCRHAWHADRPGLAEFVSAARGMRIVGVEAPPGVVRRDGVPMWSHDLASDPRFTRAAEAATAGLHGLVLAPVRGSHDILGILELVTVRRDEPDEELLHAVATAARQLGQALERDAAERALHESEERLRTTLMSVADAVITTDENGAVVDLNALAEELTGWCGGEARGHPIEDVFRGVPADDDGPPAESSVRVVLREGRPVTSRRGACLQRRDGSAFAVAVTASPIRADDGAVRGVVVVFRDETERRTEDAWRELLVEVSSALMSTLDVELALGEVARLVTSRVADGCVIYLVDAGVGSLPRAAADAGDTDAIIGADLARIVAAGQRVLDERAGASILAAPLSHGAVIHGAIAMSVERGHRAYAAVDVPRARELADRCARALETAAAFRRTELAVRARDEFLTIASHELKTPLTPLLLQVGALERMLDAHDGTIATEAVRRRLGAVHAGADRLVDLVRTMLDVARLGERIEVSDEEGDLVDVSRLAIERLADAARRAGCDVRFEGPQHLVGRWDARWIEQIVVSLLSNAIKYGRGAPVDLRLEDGPTTVKIVVVDRGIGIAETDQDRIFELFERAVPPHHYGGLGLGLWVVRRIVDGLGGRVEVDSAPGRGAVFTVALPKPAQLQFTESTSLINAS